MSVCRKLPDGTIQKIAGHTILLDANASEVRSGTGHLTIRSGAQFMDAQVTFSDPMPDTDYAVDISFVTEVGISALARVQQKTVTGFKLEGYVSNETDANVYGAGGWDFKYVAWKPVKIEGYTALQNKVNNPDDTPTIDSMNLVTSDGVARAIENASAVWKGTRAEWNALPATDKVKYDLAVLLDQTLVKAIDRTDGTETNVADLSGQFVGTHAEWEAETNKPQYKTALLTDERTTVNEVTSTGELNEVADNARIWRGTKEEWEALTDEEKDEWDQAEIETIEPKDMNPFRTLSDPEALSIAPNTDYTCPHDGFLIALPVGASTASYYINGVNIAMAGRDSTAGSSDTFPVQKGDVFKYVMSSGTSVQVYARWYTNETSPGPTDTPVLYRSQSLDWDNAVQVPYAQLASGWTVPSDGYFINAGLAASNAEGHTYVNDVVVSSSNGNTNYWSTHNVQIPVQKGDVIKIAGGMYSAGWAAFVNFVPYKDYPDYSTTEHWTGRRWIDGKKIYSKTFTFTTMSNGQVLTTLTNCENLIDSKGYVLNAAGNVHKVDGSINGAVYSFYLRKSDNVIFAQATGSAILSGHVTFEYTKTTD